MRMVAGSMNTTAMVYPLTSSAETPKGSAMRSAQSKIGTPKRPRSQMVRVTTRARTHWIAPNHVGARSIRFTHPLITLLPIAIPARNVVRMIVNA